MTEMYRITPIEGKGLGIVAAKFIKRGTLILKEETQMQHVEKPMNPFSLNETKDYFKAIMSSFDQMCESDKEEYLNLKNKFEGELEGIRSIQKFHFSNIMKVMEKDQYKADKMLKIVGICEENSFEFGTKITTSRFNHSCSPNAAQIGIGDGIRATYDIKEDQEITINYLVRDLSSMRKREYRQKYLYNKRGFTCFCDLCKKQEHHGPTENETEIEELLEEVEKLHVDRNDATKSPTSPMMVFLQYPPEKCKRHIECYKKLYKLGKEKKANRYCLYTFLKEGFKISQLGYMICRENNKHQFLEEFKNECVSFAKAAEGFGKLLGKEVVKPEDWKKRHQNFEKDLFEEIQKLKRM